MTKYSHIPGRKPCPFLPKVKAIIRPREVKLIRGSQNNEVYYEATLCCAQSLLLEGKPAQALLQLNHALSVQLAEESTITTTWGLPYQAKMWILTHRTPEDFLGNPVRHYQHLATRVNGELQELRSWRAWACFHLAERILPTTEFPRDEQQINKESLTIPSWKKVLLNIQKLNSVTEVKLLKSL